jgi:major membrane immunogen (membrane-anchored lipoprotein)
MKRLLVLVLIMTVMLGGCGVKDFVVALLDRPPASYDDWTDEDWEKHSELLVWRAPGIMFKKIIAVIVA